MSHFQWKYAVLGLLALALPAWLPLAAPGAGAHTHAQCGYLAIHTHLKQAGEMLPGLEKFFDDAAVRQAFYEGCGFPDWGYPNELNREAAEASHWRAFQLAYLDRLRTDCPPPWDAGKRRRVAFFLGLFSHGLSDTPWHFDHAGRKSLLRAAREIDGASHRDTEWAAEFFSFADVRLDASMPCPEWPMDDILAAYRAIGSDASREQLEDGRRILSTTWTGAQVGAMFWTDRYRQKYPWLVRGYRDYEYGGCEHGGAVTAAAIRAVYARLHGGYCLQQKPEYAREPAALMDYAGATDATVFEHLPDANSGGEPLLTLSGAAGRRAAALLRFDLTAIPADLRIGKATLWLCLAGQSGEKPAAATIEAVALARPWRAGTGQSDPIDGVEGRSAAAGEITWRRWVADDRMALPVIAKTVLPADAKPGRWIAIDATQAVRRWIRDPEKNFGFALRVKDGAAWTFFASEAFESRRDGLGGGTRIAYRPMLILLP